MTLAYLIDILRSRPHWKPILLHGLTAAGVFALALLPWALALYASSRSLYFPAMRGNFRADYQGAVHIATEGRRIDGERRCPGFEKRRSGSSGAKCL